MPVPLGGTLLMSTNSDRSDTLARDAAIWENFNTQPTPLNIQRSTSEATDPVIDVVTPVGVYPLNRIDKYLNPHRPIPVIQTCLREQL